MYKSYKHSFLVGEKLLQMPCLIAWGLALESRVQNLTHSLLSIFKPLAAGHLSVQPAISVFRIQPWWRKSASSSAAVLAMSEAARCRHPLHNNLTHSPYLEHWHSGSCRTWGSRSSEYGNHYPLQCDLLQNALKAEPTAQVNLGTRWRWMVNSTSGQFYLRERCLDLLDRRLGDPPEPVWTRQSKGNLCPCWEMNRDSPLTQPNHYVKRVMSTHSIHIKF
jgi:hypothetical protein